jgi:hypothetical protein
MPVPSFLKLYLTAPLFYRKKPGIRPFVFDPPRGEILIRFEIVLSQAIAFEPGAAEYLARFEGQGQLIFGERNKTPFLCQWRKRQKRSRMTGYWTAIHA